MGFVLVYLMLSALYSEPSGRISEYALPGFWAGLASYLFFCLRTQYLVNPVTPQAYAAVAWVMRGPAGRFVLLFGVAQAIIHAARWIGRAGSRWFRSLAPHPAARRTS